MIPEYVHILVDLGIGALLAAGGWALKTILSGLVELKTNTAVLHESVRNGHQLLAEHIREDKDNFAKLEARIVKNGHSRVRR